MSARIAIIAALPRELAPLVRDWPIRASSRPDGAAIRECEQAIAVCAGMGRERVEHALRLAAERGPLRSIISVGYAGALRASIARSSIHWPATVIDASTGEHCRCEEGSGTLVTADHVVGREEKSRLAERFHADLVDMEAASVARLAAERGLPFRALKIVSDESGELLPDFNRFIDARGGFREAAFAGYIALHPWLIPAAVRIGRHTTQASRAIAEALDKILRNAPHLQDVQANSQSSP